MYVFSAYCKFVEPAKIQKDGEVIIYDMCTLTYLPLSKNSSIITSNRDESFLREKALAPAIYIINNTKVAFPKDPLGGGTWIATGENGVTACLLNGAFKPHIPSPPYKKSRGLILLEIFRFDSPLIFCDNVSLKGIEPFTLVIVSATSVLELKWTGEKKYIKNYDLLIPHLWASEQLYSRQNILKRKKWFDQLIKTKNLDQNIILNFHENAGEGDIENDLRISRVNTVSTLSITSVIINPVKHEMYYKDLFAGNEFICKIR